MAYVSPSLLSADFLHLGKDVEMLNGSQADMIHLDVMDGVFVPNISFGFPVIKQISKISKLPLDVHLMIVNPERYVDEVKKCGATIMNVHVEACTHLNRVIQQIRDAGMKPAVTLNPATPLCMIEEVITDVDMILLMSVNPGFGGQKFIDTIINKTFRLKEMIKTSESKALIQIDGGINEHTGELVAEAGADVLVAGNYIFNHRNPLEAISILKNI